MEEKIIEFKAVIEKNICNFDNFKVYATSPLDNKEDLKFNTYGNVSIYGDLHELTLGSEYLIRAEETSDKKNGYGYKVLKIRRDKPNTKIETRKFLQEILTQRQANNLLSEYPNIVDMIIYNDLDTIDLSRVDGIAEKTFEKIKNKIIENFPLMDFIDEFADYDLKLPMVRKMYSQFTSIEKMREEMNKDPYKCLCSISGVGFKKADSIILSVKNNEHMVNSKQRLLSCIKFCLNENESEGNTWIHLNMLISKCNELVPQAMEYFIDAIQSDGIYIDGNTKRIAKQKTYNTEKYISDIILNMLNNSNKWLIDTSKYHYVNGSKLIEEQCGVLDNLCKYNVSLLVGNAGSGKSFSVSAVINMLDDNNKSYVLMTPTGKSAMVLSDYTSRDAGTIHRKLKYNPCEGWGYNQKKKLEVDVVIVDENGMTDVDLMMHLLEAIDTNRTKILFVQDDAQLPSVSCGNCAYDLINSGIIPITKLDKIFRYGEGGLLQIATKIRKGERYLENDIDEIVNFGDKSDYSLIPVADDYMIDYVVGIYKNLILEGNEPMDIMVLSSKNINKNGSIELNKAIQEAINPIKDGQKYLQYGDTQFRQNDIVMQIVNNYKALNEYNEEVTITNGDVGKIIKIGYDKLFVEYKKDMIVYEKEELGQLLLAYAMSIHKSQGGGVSNVILCTPWSHVHTLSRNLLYVGVTRAKKRCFHLSIPKTINCALKHSIELKRNTFLQDLLIGDVV